MNMSKALSLAAVATTALWAAQADADAIGSACAGGPAETSEVVVMADWLPWADQAPFFQAINDGTYAEAGLDVDVRSPPNPADPLKLAAVQRVQFSFTYVPEIMTAMETMVPVVSVGALIHNASEGYVHGPEVATVADLRGKKIAYINNATGRAILATVLASGGLTRDDVEPVAAGFAGQKLFATGKVDAFHGTSWGSMVVVNRQFDEEGKQPARIFKFNDHGVPPFPFILIASNPDWLQANPNTACRFMAATLTGLESAMADPEPINRWLEKARPGHMTLDDHRQRWELMKPLWADAKGRYFVQEEETWAAAQAWAIETGIITEPVLEPSALLHQRLPAAAVGAAPASPTPAAARAASVGGRPRRISGVWRTGAGRPTGSARPPRPRCSGRGSGRVPAWRGRGRTRHRSATTGWPRRARRGRQGRRGSRSRRRAPRAVPTPGWRRSAHRRAMASSRTMPKGSLREGRTNRSASARKAATSSTQPGNVTRSARPRRAACAASAARSGPSPPISSRKPTPSASALAAAASRTSKPFLGTNRPSALTTPAPRGPGRATVIGLKLGMRSMRAAATPWA